jgi:hypothetical protein
VCATNALAEEHNLAMLQRLDGEERIYVSHDDAVPVRDGTQPFKNTQLSAYAAALMSAPGLPPTQLHLKVRTYNPAVRRMPCNSRHSF